MALTRLTAWIISTWKPRLLHNQQHNYSKGNQGRRRRLRSSKGWIGSWVSLPSSGRGARFEVSVERKELLVGDTSPRFRKSASGNCEHASRLLTYPPGEDVRRGESKSVKYFSWPVITLVRSGSSIFLELCVWGWSYASVLSRSRMYISLLCQLRGIESRVIGDSLPRRK